eukprot:SAG22_NODE_869_length_6749_cov_3.048120_5_plen_164_part_00
METAGTPGSVTQAGRGRNMPAITAADIAQYHTDGYVIVRGALTTDEAARAAALTRADPALAVKTAESQDIDGGSTELESSGVVRNHNFVDPDDYTQEHGLEKPLDTVLAHAAFAPRGDVVSAWAASSRLTGPICEIWGGEVNHYYSILMRKDPGTGGWAWHQE